MRNIKQISDTNWLTSSLFFISTILYAIFIIIVCLTPSNTKPAGFLEIQSIQDTPALGYFRDLVTNVFLYIPLGIFLSLAASANKPRMLTLWLATGSILSFGIESIQFFIGRFSTATDIITNSLGFIIGFSAVVIGIKRYGLKPAQLVGFDDSYAVDTKIRILIAIQFLYICAFFIIAIFPLDVSVNISDIYRRLLPDNMGNRYIILDPFYHLHNMFENLPKLTFYMSTFLPIAILSALLAGIEKRLYILSSVYPCLMLAVYSEGVQIFIMSRTSDIIMLPIAFVAGIIGWFTVKIWFRSRKVITKSTHRPSSYWKQLIVIALMIYVIFLCLMSWSPYRFESKLGTIVKKILEPSNLIPFRDSFSVNGIGNILNLIKKICLYIPLGFLIAFSFKLYRNISIGGAIILAGLLCATLATFLELSQILCIGRYIDSTNIVLSVFGGLIGAFCVAFLKYTNPVFDTYRKQD